MQALRALPLSFVPPNGRFSTRIRGEWLTTTVPTSSRRKARHNPADVTRVDRRLQAIGAGVGEFERLVEVAKG